MAVILSTSCDWLGGFTGFVSPKFLLISLGATLITTPTPIDTTARINTIIIDTLP